MHFRLSPRALSRIQILGNYCLCYMLSLFALLMLRRLKDEKALSQYLFRMDQHHNSKRITGHLYLD